VDQRIASPASHATPLSSSMTKPEAKADRNSQYFSLWSVLFSSTFSTLVHSLLSISFHSVHLNTMSVLRQSLSRAPRGVLLRPHEVHRNVTNIALQLDSSLRKLSMDAHTLLVHAEEREESEGRLKQSLYVQTCEIMGRLLNELRRMLFDTQERDQEKNDATKEIIVGRLAYLLQFKLESLKVLLDPKCAPSMTSGTMITLQELQSSFDIEDVDDDGLVSFNDAIEAMTGAFSGTQFNGADIIRTTLFVSSNLQNKEDIVLTTNHPHQNFNILELGLLIAKGLKHSPSVE